MKFLKALELERKRKDCLGLPGDTVQRYLGKKSGLPVTDWFRKEIYYCLDTGELVLLFRWKMRIDTRCKLTILFGRDC